VQGIEAGLHVDKVPQKCTRGMCEGESTGFTVHLALTIARDTMPDAAGDTNYDAIYISPFEPTACGSAFPRAAFQGPQWPRLAHQLERWPVGSPKKSVMGTENFVRGGVFNWVGVYLKIGTHLCASKAACLKNSRDFSSSRSSPMSRGSPPPPEPEIHRVDPESGPTLMLL
jgi:hypothetical protein